MKGKHSDQITVGTSTVRRTLNTLVSRSLPARFGVRLLINVNLPPRAGFMTVLQPRI